MDLSIKFSVHQKCEQQKKSLHKHFHPEFLEISWKSKGAMCTEQSVSLSGASVQYALKYLVQRFSAYWPHCWETRKRVKAVFCFLEKKTRTAAASGKPRPPQPLLPRNSFLSAQGWDWGGLCRARAEVTQSSLLHTLQSPSVVMHAKLHMHAPLYFLWTI